MITQRIHYHLCTFQNLKNIRYTLIQTRCAHSLIPSLTLSLTAADTLDEAGGDVPLYMTTSESEDEHGSSSATPSKSDLLLSGYAQLSAVWYS